MTREEQHLSEMLKRTVPEPPLELSADRMTVRQANMSRRPWLAPAFAAAAVVAVAGGGIAATNLSSPSSPAVQQTSAQQTSAQQTIAHQSSAQRASAQQSTNTVQATLQATPSTSSGASLRRFVMPNVVGMSSAQAIAALNAAGAAGTIELTIQSSTGPSGQPVPLPVPKGTVVAQYPAAGTVVRGERVAPNPARTAAPN